MKSRNKSPKDYIKSSLNSQTQDSISTAIDDKVLSSIQNTLDTLGRANFTVTNQRSSGLQGSLEAGNPRKVWGNCPKSGFTFRNQRHTFRESSLDSHASEQKRETENEQTK